MYGYTATGRRKAGRPRIRGTDSRTKKMESHGMTLVVLLLVMCWNTWHFFGDMGSKYELTVLGIETL
jgi:hypothetical protein